MRFVVFFFFFTQFLLLFSQTKIKDFQAYKNKYKHTDAVVLKQVIDVKYFFDSNQNLRIATNKSENILYLTDNTAYLSEEIIYHNGLSTVNNITANHYSFDGKKYTKTAVKEFLTEDKFSASIFYDDNKITRVLYPKLKQFDQTDYQYTELNFEPFLSDIYYFTSYFPIEDLELRVTVPKSVNIDYKTFNFNNENIKFTKEESSDFIVFKWQAYGLKEYKISDESVPISYYKPHIAVYIKQYEKGGKSQKVSEDVASLYKWYYSLIKDVESEKSVHLVQLADSLTKNKTSNIEKIKSIYYWIQDNIKYIAIEDGYSGFIPSKADDVLQKKYGDCKGMSVLLNSLLKISNIQSSLAWVGTRDIPYTYSELPTPSTDNHMIVVVENNDSLFFLDCTSKFYSYKLPTYFIQNKEALLCIDSLQYKIVKVPIIKPKDNFTKEIHHLSFKNDSLISKSELVLDGNAKYFFITYLNRHTLSEQPMFLSKKLAIGSNKFKLDSFSITSPIDRDSLLILKYEFSLPDYAKKVEDEYYINLNLNREFELDRIDTSKVEFAIMNDYLFEKSTKVILDIPLGYSLKNIPQNSSFQHKDFGFDIRYDILENKTQIVQFKKLYINNLNLERGSFGDWNKMIDLIKTAYKQIVILNKN